MKKVTVLWCLVLLVVGCGMMAGCGGTNTVTVSSKPSDNTSSPAVQKSGLQVVGIYKSTSLDSTVEFKADGTYVDNLNHSYNLDHNPDDPTSTQYVDRVFNGTYKVEAKAGEYPDFHDVKHKTIADIIVYSDIDPSKPSRWHLTEDGNFIRYADLYVKQ